MLLYDARLQPKHSKKTLFLYSFLYCIFRLYNTIGKPFLWHLNKGVTIDSSDWHKNVGTSNINRNSVRFKKDLTRQREIYTGELLGYSGAPTAESLKEYLDFVGFDPVAFYQGMDDIEQQNS